jgi:hypothetical protein
LADQTGRGPIHSHTIELEEVINNKIVFLAEVRTWITTKTLNGHAYIRLGVRREWVAWSDRRIKYFLGKLEEECDVVSTL